MIQVAGILVPKRYVDFYLNAVNGYSDLNLDTKKYVYGNFTSLRQLLGFGFDDARPDEDLLFRWTERGMPESIARDLLDWLKKKVGCQEVSEDKFVLFC